LQVQKANNKKKYMVRNKRYELSVGPKGRGRGWTAPKVAGY
jgi:hypothetical protein